MSFQIKDPALLEVRQVFDKLNEVAGGSKVSYINYSVISKLKEKDGSGNNITNSGVFELISTAKQNRIYNKDMIVLKDQTNTFTILPSRKVIYISDAVIGKKEERLYEKLKVLQDTIFKNALKVTTELVKGKSYDKIVNVVLNDKIGKYLAMKQVAYYINTQNKTLKKVFVEYLPDQQFITLEYNFNETNFDYKKADMTIPVKNLVFESGKNLKKDYLDYKVIDNRNK
jgi:hypothetical protein